MYYQIDATKVQYSKTPVKDHPGIKTTTFSRPHSHRSVFVFSSLFQVDNETTPLLSSTFFIPFNGLIIKVLPYLTIIHFYPSRSTHHFLHFHFVSLRLIPTVPSSNKCYHHTSQYNNTCAHFSITTAHIKHTGMVYFPPPKLLASVISNFKISQQSSEAILDPAYIYITTIHCLKMDFTSIF